MDKGIIVQLRNEFEGKSPEEIIELSSKKFGNKIIFATSLGAEDQVLTEMVISCSGIPAN